MVKKSNKKSAAVRTRRAIINLLKQEGEMDSQELASRLDVSAMAVRQHLYALQDEHLVTYKEESRAMGRPAKLWQLTAAANRFFPDGYAELTLSLINSVTEAFGEKGLNKLLEIKAREQTDSYQEYLAGLDTLSERLEALAEIRTQEGYMALVQPQEDGSFLLIENHCPICAAATACVGLCVKEQEVFQAVLGEEFAIERTEHIVAGARRCAYKVTNQ